MNNRSFRLPFCTFILIIIVAFHPMNLRGELPAAVDLGATPYFPPIMDQGCIGSCDWFAAVYYQMTFLNNQQNGQPADPTNTFSPQFGYNILNNAGSFPYNIRVDDVYKFVQKHGCATLSDFPYDEKYLPWCTDPSVWQRALSFRIAGYQYFTFRGESPGADYSFKNFADFFHEIKRLLSQGEILVIQSETYASKFAVLDDDPSTPDDDAFAGESIIYEGRDGPEHTVAVVGYHDHLWIDLNKDGMVQDDEKGALKIADSQGIDVPHHNDGFMWLAYSAVGSSIFQNRINRMFLRSHYLPKVLAKITLIAAERDKIRFQFGRSSQMSESAAADSPLVFDPYGLGYGVGTAGVSLIAGGKVAFDGGTTPAEAGFVFDLSDIAVENSDDYWFLRIDNRGDQPVVIKEFSIVNAGNGLVVRDQNLPCVLVHQENYRFLKAD